MTIHLVGVLLLALVFIVGTVRAVNLGVLALAASFILGMGLAGEDLDTVLDGFPVSMFLVLFGVTYLFGIATSNGTIDWLVDRCTNGIRGNRLLLPLLIFVISAVPTILGAAGPAAVALLAPIAMRIARQNRINVQLAGMLVVHGTTCGTFSPLNLGGVIVNGTLRDNGLDDNPIALFAANVGYNVALGVVLFLVLGGVTLVRERSTRRVAVGSGGPPQPEGPVDTGPEQHRAAEQHGTTSDQTAGVALGLDKTKIATLVSFIAVATCAVGFDLDIGLVAVIAAVLLHVSFPESSGQALARVSWEVVVLICGLLTLISVLQRIGTVDVLGTSVAALGSPLLAALLILFVAAVVSAFASSYATIGAMVPLSLPLIATGEVSAIGMAIALAISTTVVDASPFSTNGALVMANAPEPDQRAAYRTLVRWGAAMVVTAPLVTWAIFVL